MHNLLSRPLVGLMLAATLAADLAWLADGSWSVDPERWQLFMRWAGWPQWGALAVWCALGTERRLTRAGVTTIAALAFWTAMQRLAPGQLSMFGSLMALQWIGVAAATTWLANKGALRAWVPRQAAKPSTRWRFRVKDWLVISGLMSVWAVAYENAPPFDRDAMSLLAVGNLIGTPVLALVAAGVCQAPAACLRRCAATTALAMAAGYCSALASVDLPAESLVAWRLAQLNLAQAGYLYAWKFVLHLESRTDELATAPEACSKSIPWGKAARRLRHG